MARAEPRDDWTVVRAIAPNGAHHAACGEIDDGDEFHGAAGEGQGAIVAPGLVPWATIAGGHQACFRRIAASARTGLRDLRAANVRYAIVHWWAFTDVERAAMHAKLAYEAVVSAASQIEIQLEPQAWPADYKAKGASPKFVDGVNYGHRFDP